MLRRKRNNSQSQPLDNGDRSAGPPRAFNPVAEITAAVAITSSTSSKQLAALVDQSPQAGIQISGGRLLAHETTERVATIDFMEKYNQESQSLGWKNASTETRKTQDKADSIGGKNQRNSLSYSHSLIIESKITGSPLAPRHEQEQNLQIQFDDQCHELSKFHHALEVLQRAARQVEADKSISQRNIFRSLAPLVIFLYLLGMGVLLPRYQRYRYSQTPEENASVARMTLLFFIGMALALVFLRGTVWVVSVVGKKFCEVNLTQIFRKGKCVDVDGRGKGEAELIWGGLLQ